MDEIRRLESEAEKRTGELKAMVESEQMRNIRLTQDLKEQEFVHQNEMMQVKLKLAQMQRVYCSDAERNDKRNGGSHMRMRSLDISVDEAGERVFDNVAEEFDDS